MDHHRSIRSVEEEAAARIAGLDAARWVQTGIPSRSWHETSMPLDRLLKEGRGLAHLVFEVAITDAPNTDELRDSDRGDGTAELAGQLGVAFLFNLRPKQQKADIRTASDAAQQIAAALMRAWDHDATGVSEVLLVNPYRPTLDPEGNYLLVEQRFEVLFDYAL